MSKKSKPMTKPAAKRIEDAAKNRPKSKTGKDRFDKRAKDAALRNERRK